MTCGNCSSKNDNYVIISHLQAFPAQRTVFDSSSLPADKWPALYVIWTPGLSVNWNQILIQSAENHFWELKAKWHIHHIITTLDWEKHCLVYHFSNLSNLMCSRYLISLVWVWLVLIALRQSMCSWCCLSYVRKTFQHKSPSLTNIDIWHRRGSQYWT